MILRNNQYVESANPCMTGGSGLWEGPTVALRVDLNADHQITNNDLVRLALFIVYTDDNRAYLMKTADMNKDGFITNLDPVMLARKIVNQA